MSAREEILGRIRAANDAAGNPTPPEPPRDYRTTGAGDAGELLELLRDRLTHYKATVIDAGPDGVPAAVAQALHTVSGPVLVPPGLPRDWYPDGVVDDGARPPSEFDSFGAVVTACAATCAETGTIALDGSADQGRRALTLVPDVHVCVVHTGQVVRTVPELLARLGPQRPTTLISGPSATSDIELERVEGVHGPRTLIVVLVG